VAGLKCKESQRLARHTDRPNLHGCIRMYPKAFIHMDSNLL